MNAEGQPVGVSRRLFLCQMAAAGLSTSAIAHAAMQGVQGLRARSIDNPLSSYPDRDWEKVYRDLYHSDSSFVFLCAPNDTHNCLLRGFVKNGVVTRIGPTFGYGKAEDLDGRRATARWDPRCCQKGLALTRRFYGDRRCKRPLVRKGFKDWIDAGMPRDPETGAVDVKYLQRGKDAFVPVTWDEAFAFAASALFDISKAYSGDEGTKRLTAQGYDPEMVAAAGGVGTQVVKFRGGMPPLGMTRVFAQYRLANMMALVDDKLRGKGPDGSVGARGWDNYSWHTDLPPGHPMVTGQQTVDFDLCNAEHANVVFVWGMNWITTKMPDSHWLTEARMKGTRVVVIACEYSATASKADDVVVVRPGTTPALALGIAKVLMDEQLFDREYTARNTDLPLLVRTDTGEMLRAKDVFPNYENTKLEQNVIVVPKGGKGPAIHEQPGPVITEEQRQAWGDHVYVDATGKLHAINRDLVGKAFTGELPELQAAIDVDLTDGTKVRCRTVFDATKELLDSTYSPEQVEKLTWAPADAVRKLARIIGANHEKCLFAMGMGPNQFFNSDLKDRAVFLVAALTKNIGRPGGNVGSYAGNYRASFFNGLPQYVGENPFDMELDPSKPARPKKFWRGESVHYFNHGDTILRQGDTVLTGKTHMPTPTKAIHVSNSNSLIGNAKGHFETIVKVFPKVEFIAINEWWWTASCEYSDIVFPVDSWAEFRYPDMSISVTNPFLYVFPTSPLERIHDSRSDVEVAAGVAGAMADLTNDERMRQYWHFVENGKMRPYIQRILDYSNATRGYQIDDLEVKAEAGIPAILQTRTYPKVGAWEQGVEGKNWYTKTGRLEFYREEPEFRDSGENLIVHREPIDSTMHEPNVIVAASHELVRPKTPGDYGVDEGDLSGDARQARHVIRTVDEVVASKHPLYDDGYKFVFHTPKYRHGAHTTAVDTDIVAIWFGPFGDMHRNDPRMPYINEMYVDIHPQDAKELGVADGDYVWIDADPKDRPFHGWKENPEWYKVARLICRARYYPGTPRGVTRMWHNMYGATYGSVAAANDPKQRPRGLARTKSGYQALFRSGSHQSCTRGWLKPTWMTDSLVVKGLFGQQITQGFVPDVHCPTGAPRESMVRITQPQPGGAGNEELWRAAKLGLRPTYENPQLLRFLKADYVKKA